MTYDGADGPLVGTDIVYVDIAGEGTPLNDGVVLPCVGCVLNFETGDNLQEGPTLWTWEGGGSFVVTGTVPGAGILVESVLMTGTFVATDNTPGLASVGDDNTSAIFIAAGVDTKHENLVAFYGIGQNAFVFANTEIALGTLEVDLQTGGFTAVPNQADIINTAVPEPATLLLLGTGLVGAAAFTRRMRRQKLPA